METAMAMEKQNGNYTHALYVRGQVEWELASGVATGCASESVTLCLCGGAVPLT